MVHLIDKDALVAEIERLYQEHSSKEYIDEAGCVLDKLEDFLDTLEVKEVNLKEELANYNMEYVDENGFFNTEHLAEYFFKLGIKAQKG